MSATCHINVLDKAEPWCQVLRQGHQHTPGSQGYRHGTEREVTDKGEHICSEQ